VIRPVKGGRSASVTMPGFAATTYGTASVTLHRAAYEPSSQD
jgi:hypothetical protein